ncbi:MAG: D-alanyl-D-alanine carboxypeptidase, partial [Oscillospiraceae bacterium]
MKKISIFLAAVILLSIITIMPAGAVSFTPNVEVASEAVYLINTDSNTVIYEKNADLKEYPASLTKIMTAILVLENIDDLEATQIEAAPRIFDEFVGVGASTADFKPYEVASAKDLMYGMLLQSACEAASIL